MSRELTLAQRAFVRVMDALSTRVLGHPLPFLRELMRTHGFAGYRTITSTIQRVQEQCVQRYGPVEANVLIASGALWNGCRFCSRSHLWNANLHYLRDSGTLFPIDDAEVPRLQRLSDEEVLQYITQRLHAGGFAALAQRVERLFHLKIGDATGTTDDDPYLLAAIAAWDWMAECTIVVEEDQAFPTDPVARDRALYARYLQARGRAKPDSG